MGTDEEFYCNDKSYKKQNLHSRLQSGMNLQICFMNETNNDEDGTARTSESDISPSSSPKPLETESVKVISIINLNLICEIMKIYEAVSQL